MSSNRRDFVKKVTAGTAGVVLGGSAMGMTARSYQKVIGANDRINIAIIGNGRRLGAYTEAVGDKANNVELLYFCDVQKSQMTKALKSYAKVISYTPKLEQDLRKVIADPKVDAVFNATPDHWHAPGAILALTAGKHVYLEKPPSHNMAENDMLVAAEKKYKKVVQIGTQQRSSIHTIEIINEIHNGVIGKPYKAIAFYSNGRGAVPLQKKVPVPEGLDWELFQGPAIHREYTSETWDYNWHWYGWNYGTAEAGNNGTHEYDVARWALKVDYPIRVDVEADKRHFADDGWEMYDTMDTKFRFAGGEIIEWDGRSRNSYQTYGSDRGTIIFGTEGTVFVNREGYSLYDRAGKLVKANKGGSNEAGTALGGGGDMSTGHVRNFFDSVRGLAKVTAPVSQGIYTMALVHYSNIAARIGNGFDIDDVTGRMYDRDAMKLWGRDYQPGWEPKI